MLPGLTGLKGPSPLLIRDAGTPRTQALENGMAPQRLGRTGLVLLQHEAAPTLFSGAGRRGGRGVPPERCLRGPHGLFPDRSAPHFNGDQLPLASLLQMAKASNLEQLPALHIRLEAGAHVKPHLPRHWPEEPGDICQTLGLPPPPVVARARQLM